MRTALRIFVGSWYLLGWVTHVYLGLFMPDIYRGFGDTALIPGYTNFWRNIIMLYIPFFALLLAGFEIVVGLLLINKGKWVKIGLVFSLLFNLFLVQMGLAIPTQGPVEDFLMNRAPNLVFMILQVPLLFSWDLQSIPEIIRSKFSLHFQAR